MSNWNFRWDPKSILRPLPERCDKHIHCLFCKSVTYGYLTLSGVLIEGLAQFLRDGDALRFGGISEGADGISQKEIGEKLGKQNSA